MKKILGLIALVVLAGCAASGVKVADYQVAALTPGETTESQVIAKFGTPTMRMRLADGTSVVIYSYAQSKVRPATFIPIVGAFAGGADTRTNTVTLRFNADGKLIDTTTSATAVGTGLGAAAGNIDQTPTNQPRL